MELPIQFKTKYQNYLAKKLWLFASFDQPENSGFRINPARPTPTDLDLSDPVPYTKWGYYGRSQWPHIRSSVRCRVQSGT